MRCATLFLLLSYCAPLGAQGLYGFDAAEEITTFQCLQEYVNFDFFVASLINASTGSADRVGVDNIRRARDAGYANVQAYVTPCAGSSCPSAHQQVTNALGTLRQLQLTLSQVWVDVGGTEWPCDVAKNRKFIWALVRSIAAYGLPVGIRTTPDRWLTIVGEWSDLSAYYPLWYARLDDRENYPCKDFVSFGGWRKFDVCQYTCGTYHGCDLRHAVGFDYWPGLKPTDTTTTTLKPAGTTTTTLKPADTTTTSTALKPDTTTTLKPADTTTSTAKPTTASTMRPSTTTTTPELTTTTTTQPTTTTKKCRLWIFC